MAYAVRVQIPPRARLPLWKRAYGYFAGAKRQTQNVSGDKDMPCGKKRKRAKIATHKRKKKRRANRHKNKKR